MILRSDFTKLQSDLAAVLLILASLIEHEQDR